MKPLDREILRLAIPSILANITVPLVGMVDLAIAGHLHGGALPAAFIGAVRLQTSQQVLGKGSREERGFQGKSY